MKEISVIIDGKKIKVPEGTTVLRAAADNHRNTESLF